MSFRLDFYIDSWWEDEELKQTSVLPESKEAVNSMHLKFVLNAKRLFCLGLQRFVDMIDYVDL